MYTVTVKTDGTKTVQSTRNNDLLSFQLHLIINFVLTQRKLAHGPVKFPVHSISHFAMNIIMAKTGSTAKVNSAKWHIFSNPPKYLPAKISSHMVLSFPVYSIHGQSDWRSKNYSVLVWDPGKPYRFQIWPEDGEYTVCSNDTIICDCVNWRLCVNFVLYSYVYIALNWSLFANSVTNLWRPKNIKSIKSKLLLVISNTIQPMCTSP